VKVGKVKMKMCSAGSRSGNAATYMRLDMTGWYRSESALKIRKSGAGFTLIEILVVMVLLGILAALAIPPVGRGIGIVKLRSGSNQVAAILRMARAKAIREQRVCWVSFDRDRNEVEVSCPDNGFRKIMTLPAGIRFKEVSSTNLDRSAGDLPTYFYIAPNGTCERFKVILVNDRGRAFQIIQDSRLHSPTIEEVADEPESLSIKAIS